MCVGLRALDVTEVQCKKKKKQSVVCVYHTELIGYES